MQVASRKASKRVSVRERGGLGTAIGPDAGVDVDGLGTAIPGAGVDGCVGSLAFGAGVGFDGDTRCFNVDLGFETAWCVRGGRDCDTGSGSGAGCAGTDGGSAAAPAGEVVTPGSAASAIHKYNSLNIP